MNKSFVITLIIAILVAYFLLADFKKASSKITTTDSIDIIKKELENADASTLIVLDCDDVLIHYKDVVFSPKNNEKLTKCVNDFLKQSPKAAAKIKWLKGIISETCDKELLDPQMPVLIKNLQEKGLKVVVLTSMKNEKLNDKYSIKIRLDELKKFGFDFSRSWLNLKKAWFGDEEKSQYCESGIVCSKPGNKSEALKNFLNYSKFIPEKMIFIDDQLTNVRDIEKLADEMKIKFKGIEYTKAKRIPYEFNFSSERLIFQLKYLEKNELWLSDKDAEKKFVKDKNHTKMGNF